MPTADDLKKFFVTGERAGAPAGARIGAAPIGSRITQAILGSGVLDQPIARLLLGSDATKARMQDPLAAAAPSEAIMIGSGSPMFNRQAAKGFTEALRKIPVAGRQHPKIVQNLWERFRTFVGPDNRLRQEISDEGLRVNTGFPNESERWMDTKGSPITVEHPELAKAYPELMEQLAFRNSRRGEHFGDAWYNPFFPELPRTPVGEIVLSRPHVSELNRLKTLSPDAINQRHRTNIAHELQHAVQTLQGFAQGSNPRMYWGLPYDKRQKFWDALGNQLPEEELAYEFYRRSPGEVEARLAERRLLNPSPDIAPPLQYDVPPYRPRR